MTKIATRQDTCSTHGPFESRNYLGRVWSRCPHCSDEFAREQKRQAEHQAREALRLAWERRIGQSGIPERFRDRTLESFVASTEGQRKALAFAQSYADNFDQVMRSGRGALFIGQPGTGKTHLACGIALQIMRTNRTVLFTTVMRAIRKVKDSWTSGAQTEGEVMATLAYPDLLILDEVGVQFGSEFERHIMFDLLNERYERRRPTIMLSNLPASYVTEYLGERVVDRLREDGGLLVVFDWQSHRGRKEAS